MPKKTKKAKLKAEAAHLQLHAPQVGFDPAHQTNPVDNSKLEYRFKNPVKTSSLPLTYGVFPHFPAIKHDLIITFILSLLAIGTELIIAWKLQGSQ